MAETVSRSESRKMEELLAERIGRRVELFCGNMSLHGEIVLVENGVLHLNCDPSPAFVAVNQVSAFIDNSEGSKNPIGIGLVHD